MNQDPVTINRIDWLRSFPILHLGKALRMGFRLRILIPCMIIPVWFIVYMYSTLDMKQMAFHAQWTTLNGPFSLPVPLNEMVKAGGSLISERPKSNDEVFYLVSSTILMLTFLGIAVARATATDFCQGTRTGAGSALKFSALHFRNGFTAVAITHFIILLPIGLLWFSGKLAAIGPDYVWFGKLTVIVMLCLAVLTIVTSILCGLAWLFSIGAIGTDRCSGSDALSRSICYVLSHKAYAVCIVVTSLVLSNIANQIIRWLMTAAILIVQSDVTPLSIFNHGVDVHDVTVTSIMVVANGVQLGVLLSGLTIGYLLLREAEDAVPLREIAS